MVSDNTSFVPEPVGTEEPKEVFQEIQSPPVINMGAEYGVMIQPHEGKFNPNQVKFLVYGESGSGKTVFASTWPRPLYLDIDKGMASIQRKVHRIDVKTIDDVKNTVKFLVGEAHPFKTLVVDSLNELQDLCMRRLISQYPNIRRAYDDLPSQSDYGKMLDDFDKLVREIKALSMNVVFIANVAPQEFETDIVQPQMVGKNTARKMARMADVIGYLYKVEPESGGGKERVMVFDAVNYVTKDRSGVLPGTLKNPSYKQLYTYWKARFDSTQEGE